MSDTDQGAPPALPLAVNLQYTKDLSFEVPHGPDIFTALTGAPQISVNIDVQANRLQNDQPHFEVALTIKVDAVEAPATDGGAAGRKVFIAELTYAAVVTLNNPPAELVEPMLLVEVPRLIFPYARNILGDITRDGGFPPVVLQPIDFVALWQARRAELAQAQAAGHA